ncbi:MAG: STAS domain-containing protein [Thermodesulfobacteriota bacterium]
MELRIIKQDCDLTHLALVGRIDLKSLEALDNRFTALVVARRKPALVDLSEVDFLASIGLRMLLTAAKALSSRGSKMVLLSPQPVVEEVLRTVGFDKIMPIRHDYNKAIEALQNPSA